MGGTYDILEKLPNDTLLFVERAEKSRVECERGS
jgi:hypothetical protein